MNKFKRIFVLFGASADMAFEPILLEIARITRIELARKQIFKIKLEFKDRAETFKIDSNKLIFIEDQNFKPSSSSKSIEIAQSARKLGRLRLPQ